MGKVKIMIRCPFCSELMTVTNESIYYCSVCNMVFNYSNVVTTNIDTSNIVKADVE